MSVRNGVGSHFQSELKRIPGIENDSAELKRLPTPFLFGGNRTVRPRFGILWLFYATAVVAAAVALFGIGGVIWAIMVLSFWLLRYNDLRNGSENSHDKIEKITADSKSGFSKVELLVVIAIIGIVIGMILPGVSRYSPGAAMRARNHNQIRQVCLALHNYEYANGHFPPAYIADEDGKPMHSWRVLILPYLDQKALYDQYDFDEPWNGPNNSKLANKLEWDVFGNGPTTQEGHLTSFKLVTGRNTGFVKDQTIGFGDIKAGSSNTIMLVDDDANPVNWMSPEDISIEDVTGIFEYKADGSNGRRVIENKFKKTTYYFSYVGMFDASATHVGLVEDPSELQEHFTIDVTPEKDLWDIESKSVFTKHEHKPDGYILVAINLFLACLPAFWIREKKSA